MYFLFIMSYFSLLLGMSVSFYLDAQYCAFYLAGCYVFFIPINILVFCSRIQISYLETIWVSWYLFLNLGRWDQSSLSFTAYFSLLLRQCPFEFSTWCPMFYEVFSILAGGSTNSSQLGLRLGYWSARVYWVVLFLAFSSFFTCT